MSKTRRILILGGDADGNLGDTAILRAMCDEFRNNNGDVELTVVSSDSERARRELGARALPKGLTGWLQLCRAARASDLVVCGGGGLFQDDDSQVKMPYWAVRVLLVRLLCKRIAGYSLGIGPLDAGISRLFAKIALGRMDPVSARDAAAQELAASILGKPVDLVPDPALLLQPAPADDARALLTEHGVPLDGRPIIGVAARRWFPPKRRIVPNKIAARWQRQSVEDTPGSRTLTQLLAQTLDSFVDRHDAHVVFLPTYLRAHEADDRICAAVGEQMQHQDRQALLRISDPALYKAVAGQLSLMLGGRMHPTIFAAAAGTPVVGLAYNPKFRGFFQLLDLGEQYILPVSEFVADRQVERLGRMLDTAMTDTDIGERAAELANQTRRFTAALLRDPA